MREIKFRVFDSRNKKMITNNVCFQLALSVDGTIKAGIIGDILMQYTGLKDKNGKEIYEGDILTYNGITSNGNEIIREVNYNAENARFQSGMYLLSQSIELSEIIGNIYENPELTQTLGFKTLMQQGRLLMYYSNLVFNFKFASFQNNFFGIFN